MIVKLLTEHHLEFLSLKGGCRGSSEYTDVKMAHCWKSHALAHFIPLTSVSTLHITRYVVLKLEEGYKLSPPMKVQLPQPKMCGGGGGILVFHKSSTYIPLLSNK